MATGRKFLSLTDSQKEVGRHFECSVRGCVPQSTCRACALKILKKWVQKIAGVPPLYSPYSLARGRGMGTAGID